MVKLVLKREGQPDIVQEVKEILKDKYISMGFKEVKKGGRPPKQE